MLPGFWLSASIYYEHPQLKDHRWLKRLSERSRSAGLRLKAHSRGGQGCDLTPDTDCVVTEYSVLCLKGGHTNRECSPAWPNVSPQSVRLIPVCTHTLPPKGYQRPYRRQILCCGPCVFVLCPALSCSASLQGGPVSSSHEVTLTQQRK